MSTDIKSLGGECTVKEMKEVLNLLKDEDTLVIGTFLGHGVLDVYGKAVSCENTMMMEGD